MRANKKGFTISEVTIVLIIIGILALVLVPIVKNMMPDEDNIKYKKAFTTIQEIVNDMVSNEETCQKYDLYNNIVIENQLQFCNVVEPSGDGSNNPNNITETRTLNEEICKRLSTAAGVECSGTTTSIEAVNGITFTLSKQNIYLNSNFGGGNNDTPEDLTVNFGNIENYTIQIHKDGKVTAPAGDESDFLKNNPNK